MASWPAKCVAAVETSSQCAGGNLRMAEDVLCADSGTIAAGQQSDHLVMAAAVQQWLAAARGPKGRKVFSLTQPRAVANCT